uniref:Sugar phosphate transporter domain-containing protein n=1 Tax=Rhodosorus marinus TaxID=101924 RepID=A0A7S2ZAU2_9RHOD|mmetsp:Transcript_11303/g.47109  ORF Transcript_11303/g.47109 Transcript_11303/m.47109 type:complete len:331 (+) Transcript_11303:95-1087(+)
MTGTGEDEKPDVEETSAWKLDSNVRSQILKSIGYCTFYILVSSMMVFTNKALTYSYGFSSTTVLLVCQMVFTAILLPLVKSTGLITFEKFDLKRALQVTPISLFYCLNGACGLMALKSMSVPSYTLIKRLAPLFTISMEYTVLNKKASTGVILAVCTMVVGTLIASQDDSKSAASGWAFGFASCILQALYLALVKKSGAQSGLNTWGVLFYHSILSVPILTVLVLLLGELEAFLSFDQWFSRGFQIIFVGSLFAGFLLNYALFLCTERTSPTSTVVSGHVKALAQTVIGFFTFEGADTSFWYLFGTGVNISGGAGYAYAKYKYLQTQGSK